MEFIRENPLPSDIPPIVPSDETANNICIKIAAIFENAIKIIGSIDELSDVDKEPFHAESGTLLTIIKSLQYEAQQLGNDFIVMFCLNALQLLQCARGDVGIWVARLRNGPVATVVSHGYGSLAHSARMRGNDEQQAFESLSEELQLEYGMRILRVKLKKGLLPLASLPQWIGPKKGPLANVNPLQQHVYQQLLDLSSKLLSITKLRVERLFDSVCSLPGRERFWPRSFDDILEEARASKAMEGKGEEGEDGDDGGVERVLGEETNIEEPED